MDVQFVPYIGGPADGGFCPWDSDDTRSPPMVALVPANIEIITDDKYDSSEEALKLCYSKAEDVDKTLLTHKYLLVEDLCEKSWRYVYAGKI